jgi:hypothetical protein
MPRVARTAFARGEMLRDPRQRRNLPMPRKDKMACDFAYPTMGAICWLGYEWRRTGIDRFARFAHAKNGTIAVSSVAASEAAGRQPTTGV